MAFIIVNIEQENEEKLFSSHFLLVFLYSFLHSFACERKLHHT